MTTNGSLGPAPRMGFALIPTLLLSLGLGLPVAGDASEVTGDPGVPFETPASASQPLVDEGAPAAPQTLLRPRAQNPAHDLVVRVMDGGRADRAVTQAQVTLFRQGPEALTERRVVVGSTGTDGRVAFGDLPAGGYLLIVEAVGFGTLEREVPLPVADVLEIVLQPRPLTLEEVIATASPLRSGVTYTAAQTFDRDELARRLDASIGSMLDGEPGVAMRSLGAAPTRPVIRGFDGDRILVLENGERMGDVGESSADHAVALDPHAVERLEVVRGPASLLYGSGALGGVVNMTTRDMPRSWSRGWEGAIQTQAASMNRSSSGSGTVVYGAHDWASTFRLSARDAGDIRMPDGRIPDTSISSLDGSLGFVRAWDELRLGISGSLVDREYGIPEAWDDPDEEVVLTMERQSFQTRLDWEPRMPGTIEGLEVRSHTSRFFQQEVERELKMDGSVEEEVGLEYDAISASITATLRHGRLGFLGEGAFGLAARAREMDIGGNEAFFPGINERSVGVFTFQEAPLTQDLSFQVGGRIETNWNDARPNERFPLMDRSRNSTALSGSLGLNWRPGAGWELGAQGARAHRVPIAEELFANGAHLAAGVFEIGSTELKDEVSRGLDLFIRRDFARGTVEVAGFANWINDYVAFQPLGRIDKASGFPVFQYQGTDARMLGAEVAADLRLNEVWSLGAGVDYVRGTRTVAAAVPLPAIPPLRSRLQLRADPGRWWAGATFRAVTSQDRVAPDELPTDGYLLLDAQAGFRLDPAGSHSILLRIDNALNERYRDHLSRLPERDMWMPGRNMSAIYRWRF